MEGAGSVWSLIWTLMNPVSCVSYVSGMYWVNAGETHETLYRESGMRYHAHTTISSSPCFATTLHVAVLIEPHDNKPMCGTNPGAHRTSLT